MIVSKDSWHYKLNSNCGGHDIRYTLRKGNKISLCEYFWETVKSILGLLVTTTITTGLIGVCGYVILSPLLLMFSSFTGIWWDIAEYYKLGAIVMIFTIILVPIFAVLSTLFGPMKVFPKWFPADKWLGKVIDKSKEHTPEKVNILVEWIKAKKSKVCPVIEFKGE